MWKKRQANKNRHSGIFDLIDEVRNPGLSSRLLTSALECHSPENLVGSGYDLLNQPVKLPREVQGVSLGKAKQTDSEHLVLFDFSTFDAENRVSELRGIDVRQLTFKEYPLV